MAVYKTVNVDPEVFERLTKVAAAYNRTLGAQVSVLVMAEYENLARTGHLFPHQANDERMNSAIRAIENIVEGYEDREAS